MINKIICKIFGHGRIKYRAKYKHQRYSPDEKYCSRCGIVLKTIRNMFVDP